MKILQTFLSPIRLFACHCNTFVSQFIFPSFPVIYSKRQAGFPLRLNTAKNLFYDFFFTCFKNQPLFATFSYFLICIFLCLKPFFPFFSFSIFHPSLIKGHFFLVSTRFLEKFLPISINFSAEFSFEHIGIAIFQRISITSF